MDGIVFVDEATYMIALETISQFSLMKIIPIKLLSSGVDCDDLKMKILKYKQKCNKKLFWGIYYTIPTYHNPTGILFSKGKYLNILFRSLNITLNYVTFIPYNLFTISLFKLNLLYFN